MSSPGPKLLLTCTWPSSNPDAISKPTAASPTVSLYHVIAHRDSAAHIVHAPHKHCPNALTCLLDTRERPPYPMSLIIRAAILGSAQQLLPVNDLYLAIQGKYPYFWDQETEQIRKV